MTELGKYTLLIDELDSLNKNITGLSEVRRIVKGHFTSSGHFVLDTVEIKRGNIIVLLS